MPKIRFTDTNLRALPHGATTWYSHEGDNYAGLRLCVTKTAKTFFASKWDSKVQKTRSIKLGRLSPQYGVKAAWNDAQEVNARVDKGDVLNKAEQALVPRDDVLPSYRQVLEDYLTHRTGERASGKSPMKPETVKKYRQAFDNHLSRWADCRIDLLPTVQINRHLNALQLTMPHGAQYAHGVAGSVVRHANKVHSIVLPTPSLTDPTQTAKRDVAREVPWADRWAEIEAVSNPYKRACWQLRWHMGARENVLRELTWDRVSLDLGTVTFARLKKSEQPRKVALSSYSLSVFRRLHEIRQSEFVFASRNGKHLDRLDSLRLTAPGDLRHLWHDAGLSLDAPKHILRWLNGQNLKDKETDMLGHYGTPDLASQRDVADRVSNYIMLRVKNAPAILVDLPRAHA